MVRLKAVCTNYLLVLQIRYYCLTRAKGFLTRVTRTE